MTTKTQNFRNLSSVCVNEIDDKWWNSNLKR